MTRWLWDIEWRRTHSANSLALQEPSEVASPDNPHLGMAVGNGEMWIVDTGEDIEIGDYVISSTVAGHAMKDVGAYETSHIVARTAEAVDWSSVSATVDGTKHRKISVFFQSFVIHNSGPDNTRRIDDELTILRTENAELKAKLSRLSSTVDHLEQLVLAQNAAPATNSLAA